MSFLDSFTFINYSKHKILKNEAFERGFKLGEELAIELLRDKQRYNCRKLNDFEKEMVMKFLEDYNFEFGYDPYNGGFYITKRRTDESR
jgi:hypothetical protein